MYQIGIRQTAIFLFALVAGLAAGIRCRASITDSLGQKLTEELTDTARINTLVELAIVYKNQDLHKAMLYLDEAIAIASRSGQVSLQGKISFTQGNLYLTRADYRNALFYFFKALRYYEQQKKYEHASRCLNNIGVVYSYLKKIGLAEKYFVESLQMREKYGFNTNNGVLYSSIGYTKSERGDLAGAITYYHRAIAAARAENDSALLASVYTNLGNVNTKLGKNALARTYLRSALDIGKAINDNYYITIAYLFLGEDATNGKDYRKAEAYILLAKEYAERGQIGPQLTEAYKSLAEIYALQGRHREAYEARLLYEVHNDSALNENTYRQVNELQASYDLEKKNNEIVLLNKDKQIAQANTQREALLRNILIIVCVFILVIVAVLIRNGMLKQRLNKSLKRENKVLAEENILTKYELLKSKVEPHFLFNSLNTLSSIVTIDREKAIEFIGHFSTLYRSILESGDLPLLPLSQELEIMESYLYLQKVRFGDKLQVEIDLPDAGRYELPPFALQMMIENAVKHNVISSARKLTISVSLKGDKLVVENNLQKKNLPEGSTGIGQKNITERYKLLSGGIPMFEDTGTAYRVTLPLLRPVPAEPAP